MTLAAGIYGHDGFKAGASGCTYSFATAANGDTTLTISAGTLLQIIEGPLYVPEGGAYIASWSGTAQGRIYQGAATGSYAASPVAATTLTAGTNTTIEWSAGTLGLVQFEPGGNATSFERRDDEMRRCQRYLEYGPVAVLFVAANANDYSGLHISFKVSKRAAPSIGTLSASITTNVKSASPGYDTPDVNGTRFFLQAAAPGIVNFFGIYAASAEI